MIDWYCSDHHFGHANIIAYRDRPFKSVAHMERELIRRHNSLVAHDDTVCFVGDFSFEPLDVSKTILRKLNGHKILVRGNHDGLRRRSLDMGFDLVVDELYVDIGGRHVAVNHYPPAGVCRFTDGRLFDQPAKPGKGEALIHGHTHVLTKGEGRRVHIGVDAWDYAPVSAAQVDNLLHERGV